MAWTAPKTWVASEDVDFGEFNTEIRDNFNETAPGKASAAGRLFVADGVNSIVERIPTTEKNLGSEESTTSTSYTDLATAGPEVTVTTGTEALVSISARMRNNTAGSSCFAAFAVSSATTIAADDIYAIQYESSANADIAQFGLAFLLTGLTAGSNVFTMKYKANGDTASFAIRRITVIPF